MSAFCMVPYTFLALVSLISLCYLASCFSLPLTGCALETRCSARQLKWPLHKCFPKTAGVLAAIGNQELTLKLRVPLVK